MCVCVCVCVRSLCEVQGVSAVCEVYRRHMAALLEWLSHTHHSWTGGSLQRTQLEVALVRSGEEQQGGRTLHWDRD